MKEQTITCDLCKKEIFTKEEKYVHIEDWNKKDLEGESWWHLNCFKKAMNRDLTILEKEAAKMLVSAKTLYSNLPNEFKTEKTIRI